MTPQHAIPIAIASLTMIDSLQRWYRSYDQNLGESDMLPIGRIGWGGIQPYDQSDLAYARRYFYIRLPGIYWERDGYRPDEFCWHYRALLWIQGSPMGWRGWRSIYLRCPETVNE